MAELALKQCNICSERFIPLEQFLFFTCGHGACRHCIEDSPYRKDPNCAICRKPKHMPHRIFLTVDELAEEHASHVVEGLSKIDMNTPAKSIKKASGKIRRLHRHTEADAETTRALLDATKDLEERVAPLFDRWEKVKKENEELLEQLRELREAGEGDKRKARRMKETAQAEKDEVDRLRERSKGYLSAIRQKDAEIVKLKDMLDEKDKKVGLMKTKLKALTKTQKHAPISDPDASLQVEGAGRVEETPRKRLKLHREKILHTSDIEKPKQLTKRRRVADNDYGSLQ